MGAICYGTLGNNGVGEGAGRLQDLGLIKFIKNMRRYWRQRKLITLWDSNVTTYFSDLRRRLRTSFLRISVWEKVGSWDSLAVNFCRCLVTY